MSGLIDRAIAAAFRKVRLGFYHATTSSSPDDYRRQSGTAEWGPDIRGLRRISSPILDIIPAIGTRLAVLSQDGVAEFGAFIGQVWDDSNTAAAMTAWLRANLVDHPGQLELGATEGIRIRVGTNTIDITPLADGTVEIDGTNIKLGASATQAVLKGDAFLTELVTAFNLHTHIDPLSGNTGTPTVPLVVATNFPTSKSTKVKTE